MKRILFVIFLFLVKAGFAQTGKDTVVYNLPVVDGKLIYADSVEVKGHNKAKLDSISKKWLDTCFIYYRSDTSAQGRDAKYSVSSQGVVMFNMRGTVLKLDYYCLMTLHVICKDNGYSYSISDLHLKPKSGFYYSVQGGRDPDYLIALYKKKHWSLKEVYEYDRPMIRNHLLPMNTRILAFIASLNKAMAN
jgi:hypothetical protein